MNKPEFITFTGADDHTSIDEMAALSAQYPIEWGILFSPKKQGQGRYPSMQLLSELFCTKHALKLSAHICGGHSRDLIANGTTILDGIICNMFDRVQVNTSDSLVSPIKIREWANGLSATAILQCRREFPLDASVYWLFDASGGKGIYPHSWPKSPTYKDIFGYAGGISPDSVTEAVAAIGALSAHYWIDMESGVRDENDRFSIDKCRQVCEAVYGVRA